MTNKYQRHILNGPDLMCFSFLEKARVPAMGVSWSRGCTNSVMLLSSKARKTKGSLTSCDLAEDTARNSPVKGSCLCWSTFPVTFTAREEPSGTSTSPEMARGRNPCRCLATCSWSVDPPPGMMCHLMTFSALSSVMQYTRMVFIQARGKFSR